MYVKIDLADERYCDGCPCLDGACCAALGAELRWAWANHPEEGNDTNENHWLRPQACIDASKAIEGTRWRLNMSEGDALLDERRGGRE